MAIPFTFNPQKPTISFDPTTLKTVGVTDNVHLPKCGQTSAEREAYHEYVAEYANLFGMTISYWPRIYDTNKAHPLYGEDLISGFHNSRKIKAVVDFKQYSAFLSQHGYMSEEEMTVYIPIREFEKIWGPADNGIVPFEDDLFMVDDSSCDRPLRQTPMVFEVSEKTDHINPVDFLGGHYVWKLVAKRYKYSYEKNAPEERFLDSANSDDSPFGRQPGGDNPPDLSTKTGDIDEYVRQNFDNRRIKSIYGN